MNRENLSFADLQINNYSSSTRDWWLDRELKKACFAYHELHSINIFVGTWNVNSRDPADIPKWISKQHDMVAVSLQEVVNLSNPIHATTDTFTLHQSHLWKKSILEHLNSDGQDFSFLAENSMVGLYMCVFIKTYLASYVIDIRLANLATGVFGIIGNKGAIAISMIVQDTAMCFVNTHLASGRQNNVQRIDELKLIHQDLDCKNDAAPSTNDNGLNPFAFMTTSPAALHAPFSDATLVSENKSPHSMTKDFVASPWHISYLARHAPTRKISQHDVIVLMGDFNSRIDPQVSTKRIFDCTRVKEHSPLLEHDQLSVLMHSHESFKNYIEAPITFSPTYKFVVGTSCYKGDSILSRTLAPSDSKQSAQATEELLENTDRDADIDDAQGEGNADYTLGSSVRAPAWCDRILVRTVLPYMGKESGHPCPSSPSSPSSPSTQSSLSNLSSSYCQESTIGDDRPPNRYNVGTVPTSLKCRVDIKSYSSCDAVMASDHKPVSAVLDCKIRKINKEKERKAINFLLDSLAEWEERRIPKLEISVASTLCVGSSSVARRVSSPTVVGTSSPGSSSCSHTAGAVAVADMGLLLKKRDSKVVLCALNKSESPLTWIAGVRLPSGGVGGAFSGTSSDGEPRTQQPATDTSRYTGAPEIVGEEGSAGVETDSARWPKWLTVSPKTGTLRPGQVSHVACDWHEIVLCNHSYDMLLLFPSTVVSRWRICSYNSAHVFSLS